MNEKKEIRELLNAAADLIETHGFRQKSFGFDGHGYCIVGAIREAAFKRYPSPSGFQVLTDTTQAFEDRGAVYGWNDSPGRTKEEAVALLRKAANS